MPVYKLLDLLVAVSVPIRGLFNLTFYYVKSVHIFPPQVSVPIRGLFNLTCELWNDYKHIMECFRPHQGII